MLTSFCPRLTYANVTGTLALFAAVGGGAVAIGGVTNRAGEIQACYDKKGRDRGDVRLLLKGRCTRGERRITWSRQGPPGRPGQPGPQGRQGDRGPSGPATGPAGGDLAGNYPNPRIASGAFSHQELGCEGNGNGDAMLRAGATCIDRYEASVWSQPNGGVQYGVGSADDYPCNDNGQNCTNIYARSVPGVRPSGNITWFQAQQALANVGKRLPTNAEWQTAVAGTPDPGTDNDSNSCNTTNDGFPANDPVNTGSRSTCVSRFGAYDMVGNNTEWVADWDEQADGCDVWAGAPYGSDFTCFGDGTPSRIPGALHRGGDFDVGPPALAGPFAASAFYPPSGTGGSIGFRGAR